MTESWRRTQDDGADAGPAAQPSSETHLGSSASGHVEPCSLFRSAVLFAAAGGGEGPRDDAAAALSAQGWLVECLEAAPLQEPQGAGDGAGPRNGDCGQSDAAAPHAGVTGGGGGDPPASQQPPPKTMGCAGGGAERPAAGQKRTRAERRRERAAAGGGDGGDGGGEVKVRRAAARGDVSLDVCVPDASVAPAAWSPLVRCGRLHVPGAAPHAVTGVLLPHRGETVCSAGPLSRLLSAAASSGHAVIGIDATFGTAVTPAAEGGQGWQRAVWLVGAMDWPVDRHAGITAAAAAVSLHQEALRAALRAGAQEPAD